MPTTIRVGHEPRLALIQFAIRGDECFRSEEQEMHSVGQVGMSTASLPRRDESKAIGVADGLRDGCSIQKGEVIFREGDLADRFYLIETGTVTMESRDGLGDSLLRWSWMFPPHTWNFTARAVEPVTAIFFDGPILREYRA